MSFHRRTFTPRATPDEIERLIYHMPTVAGLAETDFAKGFAQSMMKQSRRRGWKPSLKQLPIMRELVSDLFTHDPDQGGDNQLFE
ncbi:MAG: hypothetical protein HRU33_18395 [Rhodobacteraceae bacterium]|nr:hypothetical protein [Paracoccaceae bacterium]